MERELRRLLRESDSVRPNGKEVSEALAFFNAVKPFFPNVKVILDVAGGHGALAAVFLILHRSVERAVVIDPFVAPAGRRGILKAWGRYFVPAARKEPGDCDKRIDAQTSQERRVGAEDNICEEVCAVADRTSASRAGHRSDDVLSPAASNPLCPLQYLHEELLSGLPQQLDLLLHGSETPKGKKDNLDAGEDNDDDRATTSSTLSATSSSPFQPQDVLVVACHACQHLSDQTVDIAQRYGVHVAVMPCCHADRTQGQRWKNMARHLAGELEERGRATKAKAHADETDKPTQRPTHQSANNKNSVKKNDALFGAVTDLLTAGRMQVGGAAAGVRYDVRMKFISPKITPQNRIIIGVSEPLEAADDEIEEAQKARALADKRDLERRQVQLSKAYRAAHSGG